MQKKYWYFNIYEQDKFKSQHEKSFITSGPGCLVMFLCNTYQLHNKYEYKQWFHPYMTEIVDWDIAPKNKPTCQVNIVINSCYSIYQQHGSLLGSPVWLRKGTQGNKWIQGLTTVPAQTSSFNLVFEGLVGPSYRGDIALDDINVVNGPCPNPCKFPVYSFF